MSRDVFTRDELLQALGVITQMLHSFPNGEFAAVPDRPSVASVSRDGSSPGDGVSAVPRDGEIVFGYKKDQPQPPRKEYMLPPKLKMDRVNWRGVPLAGKRIVDSIQNAPQPLTSHEIKHTLGMADSTFSNALSILLRRKIVVGVPLRDPGRRRLDAR